jgi:hypothetical protein
MNGILPSLMCAVLFAPAPADEKKDLAAAKDKAKEVCKLLLDRKYKEFVELTHPRVVKELGGPEKMVETLNATTKQLKELGYELEAVTPGDPTASAAAGDERYVVVPYSIKMKAPAGKMTIKSFLLAISADKGKTWTFADGAGLRNDEMRKKMLPNLPASLKLPEVERPVIEKDK